jgi:photosystem II stability/assembly factor-like uncharacterized protein
MIEARFHLTVLVLSTLYLPIVAAPLAAQTVPLAKLSHIHGIAASTQGGGALYLATHEGLFLAQKDGNAKRLSKTRDDLMSLAVHPTENEVLFASGHPPQGGNLGLIESRDGGQTWQQVYRGGDRAVDFHALTVSPADPKVLYGQFDTIRTSNDSGRTWTKHPRVPGNVYALAASAWDPNIVYAATQAGLLLSDDGGQRWQTLSERPNPATMVHVTASGTVYAFVMGQGLLQAQEGNANWQVLYKQFGEQVLLQFAVDPKEPRRLYTLNQFGRLLSSSDAGANWSDYAGDRGPHSPGELRGEKLYQTHCRECHGLRGVGENHSDQTLYNQRYVRAPAPDDSTHSWHHTDDNLVKTILEGSSRESRMRGFKGVLQEKQAREIVAYLKSLWGTRALACQGPLHMDRNCLANN